MFERVDIAPRALDAHTEQVGHASGLAADDADLGKDAVVAQCAWFDAADPPREGPADRVEPQPPSVLPPEYGHDVPRG